MSVIYGNQHVDQTYSRFFEPNLYTNSWLIPGTTCTNKHQNGPAGGIYVHKMSNVGAVAPGTPGRDFSHENSADTLIQILLNNNFQKSRKMYDVQIGAISAALAEENLAAATQEVRMGREQSALAALFTEGTVGNTTAITAENVKEEILEERQALSEASGHADIILASPATYGAILTLAGKEFTPVMNERIQMEGRVGNWFGFTIFECNGLAASANATYYDHTGTLKTVSSDNLNSVDFIMYNSQALSVVDNLSRYKLQDGGVIFNGVAAQVEVNTGFRVTNSVLARVHKHAG